MTKVSIFDNEVLTSTAVFSETKATAGHSQLVLNIDYERGNGYSLLFCIEFSHDGTDWYKDQSGLLDGNLVTYSPVVSRIAESGASRIGIPLGDFYFRVGVWGAGEAIDGKVSIIATLSGKQSPLRGALHLYPTM